MKKYMILLIVDIRASGIFRCRPKCLELTEWWSVWSAT